jgi:hypothetical protein
MPTWLVAALWLPFAASVADTATVPIVLALDDQANQIWSELPDSADDRRVLRLGHTSSACASDALRQARASLGRGQAGRLALRTLTLEVPVPRPLLKATGPAGLADAAARSLAQTREGGRSDHALQPALDLACPGAALYEIRALPERPGRLSLHLLYEGGCACVPATTERRPRRFRVLGQAELEPGESSSDAGRVTLRWRIKEPRYTVMAACAACRERESEPRPEAPPSGGACGQPCAPLGQAAAGWGREVADAQAQASTLAERARALKSDPSQRPELERATRLAAEARERADELGRAAQDSRAADERCQARCQARQQPTAAATTAAAGGGISTTALVIGGAAVAGGAAAVAAGGSEGPDPEPAPPPFEGTWAGTSTIEIVFQTDRCVRGYNESWAIRRTGTSYAVDITRNEVCGTTTCGGCMSRSFPPLPVSGGTADGDRFQFPSWYDVFFGPHPCPVTGTIQGGRLSASSAPCGVFVDPAGTVFHTYRISLERR